MIIFNAKKACNNELSGKRLKGFEAFSLERLKSEFINQDIFITDNEDDPIFQTDNENMTHYPKDYCNLLYGLYKFVTNQL